MLSYKYEYASIWRCGELSHSIYTKSTFIKLVIGTSTSVVNESSGSARASGLASASRSISTMSGPSGPVSPHATCSGVRPPLYHTTRDKTPCVLYSTLPVLLMRGSSVQYTGV